MPSATIDMCLSETESVGNFSYDSGSDIDDVPPVQVKIPLRDQFKAAGHSQACTDIDWIPQFSKYMQRVVRRRKAGLPSMPLPSAFPPSVGGSLCWSNQQLNSTDFITYLQSEDINEINQALRYFIGLGLDKNLISRDTFPLPSLAAKLNSMSQDVHNGRGVSIIRGLNPLQYSFEENIIVYAGISSYIGELRGKQDRDGNILVHIKDVGSTVAPDDQRQSPYANNAQPFHNDHGDVIALYCMDKAMVGGVSRLASAVQVYNDLAAHRPDLIHELAAPNWAFDKHDGRQNYHTRPVLYRSHNADKIFFNFSRRQLTGSKVSPRPSYLPQLTEAQAEALDTVHFTADKHAVQVQHERGDIQFSNNLALFHAREAFRDGDDSQKRHLVRMWLRNERLAWPTPPELREVWDEIYGNSRPPVWYMSPDHERAHVINRVNSCHG